MTGCAGKKKATTDDELALRQRLLEFFIASDEMDIDKMVGYHYPGIFDITPREKLLELMNGLYKDPAMPFEIDSVVTDSIYPIFSVDKGKYARIRYTMLLTTRSDELKDPDKRVVDPNYERITDAPLSQATNIKTTLEATYGQGNILIDGITGSLKIRATHILLAIKDKISPKWTFLTFEKNNPDIEKLFSQQVLDKMNTYQ